MRKGIAVVGAVILIVGIVIIALRAVARSADITHVGGRIVGLLGILLIIIGAVLLLVGIVSKPSQSGGNSFRMGY